MRLNGTLAKESCTADASPARSIPPRLAPIQGNQPEFVSVRCQEIASHGKGLKSKSHHQQHDQSVYGRNPYHMDLAADVRNSQLLQANLPPPRRIPPLSSAHPQKTPPTELNVSGDKGAQSSTGSKGDQKEKDGPPKSSTDRPPCRARPLPPLEDETNERRNRKMEKRRQKHTQSLTGCPNNADTPRSQNCGPPNRLKPLVNAATKPPTGRPDKRRMQCNQSIAESQHSIDLKTDARRVQSLQGCHHMKDPPLAPLPENGRNQPSKQQSQDSDRKIHKQVKRHEASARDTKKSAQQLKRTKETQEKSRPPPLPPISAHHAATELNANPADASPTRSSVKKTKAKRKKDQATEILKSTPVNNLNYFDDNSRSEHARPATLSRAPKQSENIASAVHRRGKLRQTRGSRAGSEHTVTTEQNATDGMADTTSIAPVCNKTKAKKGKPMKLTSSKGSGDYGASENTAQTRGHQYREARFSNDQQDQVEKPGNSASSQIKSSRFLSNRNSSGHDVPTGSFISSAVSSPEVKEATSVGTISRQESLSKSCRQSNGHDSHTGLSVSPAGSSPGVKKTTSTGTVSGRESSSKIQPSSGQPAPTGPSVISVVGPSDVKRVTSAGTFSRRESSSKRSRKLPLDSYSACKNRPPSGHDAPTGSSVSSAVGSAKVKVATSAETVSKREYSSNSCLKLLPATPCAFSSRPSDGHDAHTGSFKGSAMSSTEVKGDSCVETVSSREPLSKRRPSSGHDAHSESSVSSAVCSPDEKGANSVSRRRSPSKSRPASEQDAPTGSSVSFAVRSSEVKDATFVETVSRRGSSSKRSRKMPIANHSACSSRTSSGLDAPTGPSVSSASSLPEVKGATSTGTVSRRESSSKRRLSSGHDVSSGPHSIVRSPEAKGAIIVGTASKREYSPKSSRKPPPNTSSDSSSLLSSGYNAPTGSSVSSSECSPKVKGAEEPVCRQGYTSSNRRKITPISASRPSNGHDVPKESPPANRQVSVSEPHQMPTTSPAASSCRKLEIKDGRGTYCLQWEEDSGPVAPCDDACSRASDCSDRYTPYYGADYTLSPKELTDLRWPITCRSWPLRVRSLGCLAVEYKARLKLARMQLADDQVLQISGSPLSPEPTSCLSTPSNPRSTPDSFPDYSRPSSAGSSGYTYGSVSARTSSVELPTSPERNFSTSTFSDNDSNNIRSSSSSDIICSIGTSDDDDCDDAGQTTTTSNCKEAKIAIVINIGTTVVAHVYNGDDDDNDNYDHPTPIANNDDVDKAVALDNGMTAVAHDCNSDDDNNGDDDINVTTPDYIHHTITANSEDADDAVALDNGISAVAHVCNGDDDDNGDYFHPTTTAYSEDADDAVALDNGTTAAC